MFVSLWNYLRGYVIVEVSGYALEKFMNLALKDSEYFWNITRKNNKMYLHTTTKGFKRLKPYAKRSKCHLHITEKRGLPFLQFRYRKRWMLAIGSLIFVGLLYLLCSFVWLVEVEGCQRLNDTEVIETLETHGYEVGKFKGKLDLRKAEQVLIDAYPEIIWTGVKYQGTKLVIQISESVPKPVLVDEKEPCNLVATRDALITYIATDRGMPQVKKGDTVKKGDLLVSGSIPFNDESGASYLAHAKAQVRAKTGYALTASMPLESIKKEYTQRVSTRYNLKLFDFKIPIWKQHAKDVYNYYDEVVTVKQFKLTKQFPLPFYFERTQKVEYIPQKQRIEEDVAKEKLYAKLYDTLLEKLDKDSKVLYHEVTYKQEEGKLVASLQAIVEEDVSERVHLTAEEMMPLNGVEGENE
ncbi:MAG: sporulation protein YqfD [Niameybacter sp.]|uniref:sporulation protein YqfD n=1 Tax=Niameybacter sp. TaxID=2033640 RepID=UPI002FCAC783